MRRTAILITVKQVPEEEKTLEFYFPIEPVAVQSAKFFRCGRIIRAYQPARVTDFKQIIRLNAMNQLPEGHIPWDGPVLVEGLFIFTPPKSMKKSLLKVIEAGGYIYKTTKPDVDNLTKAVFDAMSKTVWRDDAPICDYHIRKGYGLKPFIRLKVTLLSSAVFYA